MRRDAIPAGQRPGPPPLLAPLDSVRHTRTASSRQHREACSSLLFERAPEGSRKMLAATASMHQESMRRLLTAERDDNRPIIMHDSRPSTSAPAGRAGGTFTRAPPRDLLASRGAQFRISALEKAAEHEIDECQRCADYRTQIKSLKRRLASVRYADVHLTRDAREDVRAERDQLKLLVANLQSKLEQNGGQTARRHEVACLKHDLKEAEIQRSSLAEENEAHIAEMQQIILNRDESIEVYKQDQQRLQESLRALGGRLHSAEAASAVATASLHEAQNQLAVQHAGSASEKEQLLQSQVHGLSIQLLDAEERLRLQDIEQTRIREEESERRAMECVNLSCAIEKLVRSIDTLEEALQKACRREESNNAMIKQLKLELGEAQYRLASSGAERDRNIALLARENGDMRDILQSMQQQMLALNNESGDAVVLRRQLEDQLQEARADHERSVKEAAELEKRVRELQCDTTKRVVVVTPKICVSVAPGQLEEIGKLDLPESVLRKLVAKQLGYDPDELFKAEDEASLANIDLFRRSSSHIS